MRFECYRNKAVVVKTPIEHQELESTADIEPIVSEPGIENKTTSDTTEKVAIPSLLESNEDMAGLPKEETTPSTINNTFIEESNQPSKYEIYRATAMAEKERASQEKLDKVLTYIKQTLVLYLNEIDLNRLCEYVTEYYLSDTLSKVEPIKVDSQLKTIDIMHLGWNIGKAFGKPRLQTATFIKKVFAHALFLPKQGGFFILSVIRKYLLLSVKCRILNQNARLNWIEKLVYNNIVKHYPLHPSSPYPSS